MAYGRGGGGQGTHLDRLAVFNAGLVLGRACVVALGLVCVATLGFSADGVGLRFALGLVTAALATLAAGGASVVRGAFSTATSRDQARSSLAA